MRTMTGRWHQAILLLTVVGAVLATGRQSCGQDRSTPPGIIIDKSPDFKQIHVGSPSLEILPDGAYLASHDWFGPGYGDRKVTVVFESKDKGRTWQKLSEFEGQKGSMMFAVGNVLWHIGWCTPGIEGKNADCIAIRRSSDGGKTWTVPTDDKSGLLLSDKRYFVDPAPVLLHKGRVWKEVEVVGPRDKGPRNWATGYQPMVASAPQGADLLDRSNWTFSNSVPWTSRPGLGGWLEGNVLFTPEGKMIIQMRVDDIKHCGKAAQIQVSDDGRTASYDPAAGFVPMPGGCKKFVIKFDSVSKKYWSLVNWVHPLDVDAPDKERVRNTLALVCSDDLKSWTIRSIVWRHPSTKIGFQYCDWRADGDDMVFICRLAWEGAPNCHDANYLTFHRLKNFRAMSHERQLKQLLQRYPEADANRDGTLTLEEAETYRAKMQRPRGRRPAAPAIQPTQANVHYGPHERQVLDFYQAKSAKPTPVVIYIHGGGFVAGDKSTVSAPMVRNAMDSGISFAAINYRFVDGDKILFPIPQRDGARAVQFIRSKASEWNIDPARVACFGGSAGAGISMWIGFHDDLARPDSPDPVERQSTRIQVIGTSGGQGTYDPVKIKELVGGLAHAHPSLVKVYGLKSVDEALHPTPELQKLYDESAAITHLTKDDPPLYMVYNEPDVVPPADSRPGQFIHHPNFGRQLKAKMDSLGIENVFINGGGNPPTPQPPGGMIEFFKKHLLK